MTNVISTKRKLLFLSLAFFSVGLFGFQSFDTSEESENIYYESPMDLINSSSKGPTYGTRLCYIRNADGTVSNGNGCGTASYANCTTPGSCDPLRQ